MKKKLLLACSLCVLAVPAILSGCGEEGGTATGSSGGSGELEYGPMLTSLAEQVAVPAHTAAATTASELVVALRALESSPSAETLGAAQVAWRTARAAYRKLDAFTFGPLTTKAIDARIDVAPADPSGIEKEVTGTEAIDARFVGASGGKKKGWLALEYLLFRGPGGDVLASFATTPRRGQLARAIAEEIETSTAELRDAWDPAKGGYANEVKLAGESSQTYGTQRAALDDLVGGGGYALELVVGIRLANPLGRKNKSGAPSPDEDPTLASDSAVADMVASLEGVSALYKGSGFSSLVRSANAALDDSATAELDACLAAVRAIPAPFGTSVTSQTQTVQAAFEACKAYKLTWNTDLTQTLGATLKPLDTDGD
jgi:predicted lipoprotein